MTEHFFHLNLLGVHEEGVRDIHRAEFLALAAVDAAVGDMGEPDQVEHEVRGNFTRGDQVGFTCTALDTVADRTCLNTGVALDTLGGLLYDRLQAFPSLTEVGKVFCPPLVAKFQHCTLYLSTDLDPLGVGFFGLDDAGLLGLCQQVCTLLAAYFDEGRLPGLVADDSPVAAGKVCTAWDFQLAAAAVRPPAVALLLEFVHGDALVASLVLDDELSLVDLFLG